MKKLFSLLLLIGITIPALAQLHVRVNLGYNLAMGTQVIGTDSETTYDQQLEEYVGNAENVYGSYGSGFSFHAAIGGTINGMLGYDVEAGYLIGKKYSTGDFYYEDSFYNESYEAESYSRSFQVAPSITFTGGTGNVQPYTRIGPVVSFTKLKLNQTNLEEYDGIEEKEEYEATLKGSVSFGFKGVLGVTYNAAKKIQFFTELSFISMAYSPTEGEITAYRVNGENALDDLDSDERKIEFKDKIDEDDEDNNVELREKFAMGSIGLQVGIKYVLK